MLTAALLCSGDIYNKPEPLTWNSIMQRRTLSTSNLAAMASKAAAVMDGAATSPSRAPHPQAQAVPAALHAPVPLALSAPPLAEMSSPTRPAQAPLKSVSPVPEGEEPQELGKED
jgi:hypothetical protein